ncbi:Probable Rho GTPase-activating protein CG5521 [Eumeta japonica]|uniref:Probable Rho GTPase-activating protein CG5521 n=1 Tax=Eumeta variegata TaxID=151549 RepID=A0A4C1THD6_EUMVA|nr:Probable Rho GTPase-activating protein CG5521 [Eumeta japonica]
MPRTPRFRVKHRRQKPPVNLPSSVENSLNTIVLQNSNSPELLENVQLNCNTSINNEMRRAMSLDSLATSKRSKKSKRFRRNTHNQDDIDDLDGAEEDSDDSRSPSPTASSGIEGGSIKDAQIQIDVLAVDSGGSW